MAFRLEYRTDHAPWEIYMYCGTVVMLMEKANKLRSQGFAVRCINEAGQDILNKD